MSLLEIKDLVIHYITESGVVQAVNGVTLSLEKGQTFERENLLERQAEGIALAKQLRP